MITFFRTTGIEYEKTLCKIGFHGKLIHKGYAKIDFPVSHLFFIICELVILACVAPAPLKIVQGRGKFLRHDSGHG